MSAGGNHKTTAVEGDTIRGDPNCVGRPINTRLFSLFHFRGISLERSICQKFAKNPSRFTLPAIRVGECSFRSFWTIGPPVRSILGFHRCGDSPEHYRVNLLGVCSSNHNETLAPGSGILGISHFAELASQAVAGFLSLHRWTYPVS